MNKKIYIIETKYFETALAILAFVVSGIITWRVFTIGMMKALVDQNSHLNLSRQFFDSLTPGISQIGFWPPLLHIFMAPYAYFDSLYQTGLAGYVVLAPSLIAAAIFLYRICLKLSHYNYVLSFWAVLLFILNPFILYYTATPMMEVLYLAFLFGSAYFLLQWIEDQKLRTLIVSGIFVSLTTISRFEGLFLIPISLLIVILYQVRRNKNYHEIEAIGIIFGILGVLGVLFIFGYGYIYGGNILSFANSQWSAFNQQRDYILPTEHNLINSFIYLIYASYHVLGQPMVLLSLFSILVLGLGLVARWGRLGEAGKYGYKVLTALAVLGSPFLFDLVALIRGNAIIYVPELFPYGVFFNERYGLYWVGFVIVTIILALSPILQEANKIQYGYKVNLFLLGVVTSFLVIWNAGWLIQEAFIDNYALVKDSAQGYPSHDQAEVSTYLQNHYDGGKIFMTRALHDFIAVEAHVPLKNYIHESNYKYFDQVLERPWLFAKWVVMYNPGSDINGNWAKFNEKISGRYGHSEEFLKYYTKVVENDRERLYKLNPEAVVTYAASRDYSVKAVPSLNADIKNWNPDTIYAQMDKTTFVMSEVNRDLLSPELVVSSSLIPFYNDYLKSLYKDGYVANAGKETIEFQAQALLQAFWAGDKATFDTVWDFNKTYLQHENDNLFVRAFAVDPQKKEVTLTDETASTGAETDIAYALLRAGKEWQNSAYTREGTLIAGDLWEQNVASVEGKLLITADTKSTPVGEVRIKTAAIKPYAYREFGRYDRAHNWMKLAADSYELLKRISGPELHKNTNIFLPAEGAVVVKSSNKIDLALPTYYETDFVNDTYQIYWNVAVDAVLHNNKQAKDFLFVTNIFDEEWKKGNLCSIVTYEKDKYVCNTSTESQTALLSLWTVKNRKFADQLVSQRYVKNRLISISPDTAFAEKSWFWLGLLLWNGKIF